MSEELKIGGLIVACVTWLYLVYYLYGERGRAGVWVSTADYTVALHNGKQLERTATYLKDLRGRDRGLKRLHRQIVKLHGELAHALGELQRHQAALSLGPQTPLGASVRVRLNPYLDKWVVGRYVGDGPARLGGPYIVRFDGQEHPRPFAHAIYVDTSSHAVITDAKGAALVPKSSEIKLDSMGNRR